MPKGAVLHLHFDTANDNDWFMKELAFKPTTFYNSEKKKFKYFKNASAAEPGYFNLKDI